MVLRKVYNFDFTHNFIDFFLNFGNLVKFEVFVIDKNRNSHPYEAEITGLMESFQLEEFRKCIGITEKNVGGLEEMSESYEWVETESKLKELAEVLSKEKVFAVDTEQHSFRSFLGFTALIQVNQW